MQLRFPNRPSDSHAQDALTTLINTLNLDLVLLKQAYKKLLDCFVPGTTTLVPSLKSVDYEMEMNQSGASNVPTLTASACEASLSTSELETSQRLQESQLDVSAPLADSTSLANSTDKELVSRVISEFISPKDGLGDRLHGTSANSSSSAPSLHLTEEPGAAFSSPVSDNQSKNVQAVGQYIPAVARPSYPQLQRKQLACVPAVGYPSALGPRLIRVPACATHGPASMCAVEQQNGALNSFCLACQQRCNLYAFVPRVVSHSFN
ncbi:hypothetical protein Ciccas_007216 [Cichlidogyrus casuarinus]|uniref:Uncharacterized protein n=1 Tax=Cichlidogyrus casuarinus TaxID=1844966 RepID=A0ABD2Q3U2_9PLAT